MLQGNFYVSFMKRFALLLSIFLFLNKTLFSQGCCSGGSGSPIAGGTSQGVLLKGQVEIGGNYQYSSSNKFFSGDKDTASLLKNLSSNYLYLRLAYGLTEKLTLSLEGGYFLDKTLVGLNPENIYNTKTSSGISDIIIFPRYDVYDKTDEKHHTEVTLGLGIKIPVGKYCDSTLILDDPSIGKFYSISPPTVQPTTGSTDFIFYGFAFREYKKAKFRVFANALYVKKGWNSLGEKFGDYASIGLFGGKTFFKKLGITLQLKGEWINKMELVPYANAALLSVEPFSTGGYKFSFIPQINYTFKSFTVFGLREIPLYQYQNGAQVGMQYFYTAGLTYRFMPAKSIWKQTKEE